MKRKSTYKGGEEREAYVLSAPGCRRSFPSAFSILWGLIGPLPWLTGGTLTKIQWLVKIYTLKEDQQDNQGHQQCHPAMWSY